MRDRKVIIVGAGIGGLPAGYWLGKTGYEVEILEAAMRSGADAVRRVCGWGGTMQRNSTLTEEEV